MTASFALPFLTLSDEAVSLGPLMIGQSGSPLVSIKPILEGWDYAADVELTGSISIDMRVAAEILAIAAEELKLAVTLKIGTGRGRFPRVMRRVSSRVLDASSKQPTELRAIVPGYALSGRLFAGIDVLLAAPPANISMLSPNRIGARLWSREISVELEDGGEDRFPWKLFHSPKRFQTTSTELRRGISRGNQGGLAADFGGSIRLYVNSDHQELAQRVVSGDDVTLQTVLGDVMVQIIAASLDIEDLEEQLSRCEEGSVGAQISSWIALAFPRRSISEIRSMRHSLPGQFHASIYAAAELGDME